MTSVVVAKKRKLPVTRVAKKGKKDAKKKGKKRRECITLMMTIQLLERFPEIKTSTIVNETMRNLTPDELNHTIQVVVQTLNGIPIQFEDEKWSEDERIALEDLSKRIQVPKNMETYNSGNSVWPLSLQLGAMDDEGVGNGGYEFNCEDLKDVCTKLTEFGKSIF